MCKFFQLSWFYTHTHTHTHTLPWCRIRFRISHCVVVSFLSFHLPQPLSFMTDSFKACSPFIFQNIPQFDLCDSSSCFDSGDAVFCRKTAGGMLCSSQGADFPFPFPGAVLCGEEPFLPASLLAAASSLLVSETWSCRASAQQMVKRQSVQTFWWAGWETAFSLELFKGLPCFTRTLYVDGRGIYPRTWGTQLLGTRNLLEIAHSVCYMAFSGSLCQVQFPAEYSFLDQGTFTIEIFHKYS